jgi:hypothetical protein
MTFEKRRLRASTTYSLSLRQKKSARSVTVTSLSSKVSGDVITSRGRRVFFFFSFVAFPSTYNIC